MVTTDITGIRVLDAITDVPGIRVGHATRDEPGWLTGTTVVLAPPGSVGGVDVRGGGPGTRETDLLDPRHAVDAVDAIVLSGGSAFGLAAAEGVMAGLADDGRGWPAGPGEGEVVPIVPAAIVFDLGRGGTWRNHPGPAEGRAAYEAASGGPVDEGGVGAGTGARAGGLKGGVGTASAVLPDGKTVGAIVVVNAVGSPVAQDGSLLAAPLLTDQERAALPPPDPEKVAAYQAGRAADVPRWPGRRSCRRRRRCARGRGPAPARRAPPGRASRSRPCRGSRPSRRPRSSSRSRPSGPAPPRPGPFDLVDLQTEAARCVSRAIAHAMLAATTVDRTADGGALLPGYREAIGPG